jgi:AcrR family transcriptional regulator
VFGDSVHQPIRIVPVDAQRRRPADHDSEGVPPGDTTFTPTPSPGHRRRQRPSHLSDLDPGQIPGYSSLAARRITKPTIGITVTGGNGDPTALPQINRQLPVDSSPPDREAGTAGAVLNGMEVPAVAKQATAEKRQRRERGSINPDDIISGAFELAEQVSIDNLSMPLLGKHLGVGVTSIYWYFRKKDDLLNAMTDRALRKYVFATPYVEATDWRETLRNHARSMRKTFMGNPILCDLILIRSALSPRAARLGVQEIEKAIGGLVEAGLSPEEAFDTYSAVSVHVRGSVVLHRLQEKNQAAENGGHTIEDAMVIDPEVTPLLAQMTTKGHHIGTPDDNNFEYGLDCILDHASRLIDHDPKSPGRQRKSASSRQRKSPSAGRAKGSRQ